MFSDDLDALKYRLLTDDYYEAQCDNLQAEFLKMMHLAIVDHPKEALAFGQMANAEVQQKTAHRMMREKSSGLDQMDDIPPDGSVHLDTPASDNVDDL